MIEIDVTDPKLDWTDYTSDELVNANLIAPRTEGANFTKADIDLKTQAENDLREHLSPEDEDRRIRVLWRRAQDTIDGARRAMTSMGTIRTNLKAMQDFNKVPTNLIPTPKIDMDKILKSMTNQLSQQMHIKVSPEGKLTTTPTGDNVPSTPELTEPEQEVLREAQTISGSKELDTIVSHVAAVSTTLKDQNEASEKQATFNRRGTIISIIVATLSLALAITTACMTLFEPAPIIEYPTNPIPVEVIEPTNE
ncbi:hypothetical protein [Brevibacterium aurantiacum]|uniref:Uncharacterized protein n=1 Tax=Brevibacterium aurantiacum TaxID=273384 RepID=A0A2A3YY72_BREAU|nr:hypothetical protein [Brevibacterium aurantiacum]PCC44742.1 hypothetical protein CIK65_00845 [Brevibacterium aurantiacum]